jgi:hypothetical protein
MLKSKYACALILTALASPAFADKFFAVTPSGAAEMLFPDSPDTVIGKLSSRCIDVHWTVVSSSSKELVCEAPLNMGQSIVGQVLLGNSYSTPPRRYFRFNVAPIAGISRAQASGWTELQMAFGQTKRSDFSGPEFHNGAMNFMGSAGGRSPVGTTFPNHVMVGVKIVDAPQGRYEGLRITDVQPGSPAAKGGLQVDDIITQIAGKRFKNMGGYLDAIGKAAESPSYQVEFLRGGKAMTVSLERMLRPAITEPVIANVDTKPQPAAIPSVPSIADELEKREKLKARGVLTDAEFQSQKKKLLSQ